MKNTHVKNALLGVAIAFAAAYLFPFVFATLLYGSVGLQLLFSEWTFQVLFYVSWIVIPLGVALGVLIPRVAAGKRRWVAALHGAGYGAVGGLAAMICFASVFLNCMRPDGLWVGIVVYCAVWVGAYAYIRAKAPVLHR